MRRLTTLVVIALGFGALFSHSASAGEYSKFALETASASLSTQQAGAHPDLTTSFGLTRKPSGQPWAKMRNLEVELPPGIFGDPVKFPVCTNQEFGNNSLNNTCPQDSQVGVVEVTLGGEYNTTFLEPLFLMEAPGGAAARFGFYAKEFPTFLVVRVRPDDHGLTASLEGTYGAAPFISATTTLWGVPAAESHDFERPTVKEAGEGVAPPKRSSNLPEIPFMTNPTRCGAPLAFTTRATNYQIAGVSSSLLGPFPEISGCESLSFQANTTAAPTTEQGTSGSGLNYELDFPTDGLGQPNLTYNSELKRDEVVLPEGVTVNPSEAEGLGVCTEADFERETYASGPNQGCPESSKIGSASSATPVLAEEAEGSLYIAKPYANPFGSLLAVYLVLKIPARGVIVKLAGQITPNESTGQLTATFDNAPELPVENFKLHFREGARAPLVTPVYCGTYQVLSRLSPWASPASVVTKQNSFNITSGPNHGPCAGASAPFHPTLVAGTINNAAGSYSPFVIRLGREDAEQEFTHFSIKLPPGVSGKLAGIPFCSDAAIAAAKARTGPKGGQEEIEHPSCPAASEVGSLVAGVGVGQVLARAPGKVYLAGPYHGSALSIIAITAAKVGPFDLGTVVVREALKVNPETAEVFIDATGSDPLPHIIQGIPVHLRELVVDVDRPEFVINPTSCERTSTASTVLGSGTNFASESDDQPVTVTSPFQAASCASLGFAPKLSIALKGGTKRSANPALKAVVTPRKGDANIGKAIVALPPSEFLEQGHIKTVCTRVQFAAGGGNGEQCPAASVYGRATAVTPLLSEPLHGPVFLRSSSHKLPDLVAALHGSEINIDLDGRIDSAKGGGIRTNFEAVPDAPVTKFTLEMFGGKKSLLVNSTNICKGTHKATAEFSGQNGKTYKETPAVTAKCGKNGKGKKSKGGDKKKRADAARLLPRLGW